jgi:metal-dependent amidase/aminoacylase/carboxypeptidase family protein
MTGTIRTIEPSTRARLRSHIEQVVSGLAVVSGARIDLVWANEMPAVINDAALVDLARSALPGIDELSVVDIDRPPMTTDDFALFAQKVPGLYLKLGCSRPGDDEPEPLHSSLFDIDERAVGFGIAALEELVRLRL